MQKTPWAVYVVMIGLLGLGCINSSRADSCPAHSKQRLFTINDSGESLAGPLCVSVSFNALKYTAAIGRSVSYSAGPNLQAGFAPPPKAGGGVPGDADLPAVIAALGVQRALFLAYDSQNRAALATVTQANSDLRNLVSSSDDLLRSSGPGGVLAAAHGAPLTDELATAASATWKATDDIYDKIMALENRANQLLLEATTDAEKSAVTAVQQQLTAFATSLSPTLLSGTSTSSFYKALSITRFWQNQIQNLKLAAFTISAFVDCPNVFNQNRSVAVSLIEADLTPTFDGSQTIATSSKTPFVTVTCASPFVVSAGVELSFLKSPTFGLVPTGTTGSNHFGITDNGSINPLPIGVVHWRLAETGNHMFAFYGSFGAAAHIQGNSSGSSAAEYLTGASLGILRTVFLTPGWHVGKVAALGGGYSVGQAVPSGVTTVPVQSSYQSGFGLSITFTKP